MQNPYAAPVAAVREGVLGARDSADLYIETLPSPVLRGAFLAWLATGIVTLFLSVRMLLSVVQGPVAVSFEAGHAFIGFTALGVGFALVRGRTVLALAGFGVAPAAAGLSLFALLTGSIAGLVGLGTSLLALVLTAVTFKESARIGRARQALAAIALQDAASALRRSP